MIVKEDQNETSHLRSGSLWAKGLQNPFQELKSRRVLTSNYRGVTSCCPGGAYLLPRVQEEKDVIGDPENLTEENIWAWAEGFLN